jgi:transcriptional regulator GlxA family with amidase domain
MITRAQLIDVLFVIVPHSLMLDIAGPAEAFRLANQHRERRGLPPRFRLGFAGPVSTLPTSVGLPLGGLVPLPEQLSAPTWVVVVGQPTAHVKQVTPEIAVASQWLSDRLHDALLDAAAAPPGDHLLRLCSPRGGLLAGAAAT